MWTFDCQIILSLSMLKRKTKTKESEAFLYSRNLFSRTTIHWGLHATAPSVYLEVTFLKKGMFDFSLTWKIRFWRQISFPKTGKIDCFYKYSVNMAGVWEGSFTPHSHWKSLLIWRDCLRKIKAHMYRFRIATCTFYSTSLFVTEFFPFC